MEAASRRRSYFCFGWVGRLVVASRYTRASDRSGCSHSARARRGVKTSAFAAIAPGVARASREGAGALGGPGGGFAEVHHESTANEQEFHG